MNLTSLSQKSLEEIEIRIYQNDVMSWGHKTQNQRGIRGLFSNEAIGAI